MTLDPSIGNSFVKLVFFKAWGEQKCLNTCPSTLSVGIAASPACESPTILTGEEVKKETVLVKKRQECKSKGDKRGYIN